MVIAVKIIATDFPERIICAFTNIIEFETVTVFQAVFDLPIGRSIRDYFHEWIYDPRSDAAAIARDVRLIRHARRGARLSQLSANIRKLAYRCARATDKSLLERAFMDILMAAALAGAV